MFVRTTSRKTKTGKVTYVQLAHNTWDAEAKRSKTTVVHSFGREEDVDADGVRRLIGSLQRLIGAEPATGEAPEPAMSVPVGGAALLDGLWRRLGLDALVASAAQRGRGRRRDLAALERVLFALVANRALAPSSKLAAAEWMNEDVHIPGLEDACGRVDEDACYRAMDWLHETSETFCHRVYDQVRDLFNLEVDVLFFDTTSTYFETDVPDETIWRDRRGEPADGPGARISSADGGAVRQGAFRTWGHSKDHRGDLPQVIVGLAVTRTGLPVRAWCWPGNTGDSELIRQVHADMRHWSLSRVIYAADRGFSCEANRRDLMSGADGYILGEKMRTASKDVRSALSRPGRYAKVADNLEVKEVKIATTSGPKDRFIICHNREQAVRDAATRDAIIAKLAGLIHGTDAWSPAKRSELRGRISTMPGPNRFLRVTDTGLLRVCKAKIDAEAKLDGKYLLRTSDPKMTPADVALGYKQLLQVERGWRDLKSTLDLRPVYHRLEDRIRAHVTLCWLALLLVRIAENETGHTWATIRRQAQRVHAVTYQLDEGAVTTPTRLAKDQAHLFDALKVPTPKQLLAIAPAQAATAA